ncbi:MAG TPA: cation transporting ATPase C-terminal domain-containing protein, partial [Verrucomicrobiales bacterium]|nr:cation transporting ATPase C-terminal domain-containing protein [Verrucomicrobiales bacterium]
VMRNPAVWVALAICAALIALAIQVPTIAKVLALRPPSPGEWLLIVGLGLVTVVAEWGRRLLTYRR